jgi:hypothetical protein
MDTVSYLKPKNQPLVDYAVLLSNGEVVDITCHVYEDVCTEEGDTISYRFFKDKRVIAELGGAEVKAIISKTDVNHEAVIKALKKSKPRRKAKTE